MDRARIESIVDAICERAAGEWLLVGGAMIALWLESRRTTQDLDLIGMQGTNAERRAIMEIAESLGLPIETMNGAADWYVHKIADWRTHVVEFRRGPKGTVFRPDATLFLLLKLQRLDERDLEDCRAIVAYGEPFDRARIRATLAALPEAPSATGRQRRAELLALID